MFHLKNMQLYKYRSLSTTPVYQISTLIKLKKLQSDFQADDGKPVWLKGGMKDRILVALTAIACYTGLLMSTAAIYDLAKPTSWRKSHTC